MSEIIPAPSAPAANPVVGSPIGLLSGGIWSIPHLEKFLGAKVTPCLPVLKPPPLAMIVGWGRKSSANRARRFAKRHQLPYLSIEDGFLRSLELGETDPPLSLVLDDVGIYYDASGPSRLEALIQEPLSAEEKTRATALMDLWRQARASKYNHQREVDGPWPKRFVLVVDQTLNDASITYGQASPASFQQMLEAAIRENPDCEVLLKVHPEVMSGRKSGHFDLAEVARRDRVTVVGMDVHPVSLLERAEAIYVVTSQMGFEGLLWGKPVKTYGMPFYAGWGLTQDAQPANPRRTAASLEQLVTGALIRYARYVHPETRERCQVEEILNHLALQLRMRRRFPTLIHACGFSLWKERIVRDFCQGSQVRFVSSLEQVPSGSTMVRWGRKPLPGKLAEQVHTIQLEDGFLRSVGLGAHLIRPLSWVMDPRGIYYDATAPSELEHLLQNSDFPQELTCRAEKLREGIVAAGLTKYNVGSGAWQRPSSAQRVILVPGQVESDASIQYGAGGIRTNLELLQAVKRANPEAHLIYKPHPDVVAGLRQQGAHEEEAARWCNELVISASMGQLLDEVDEVHLLTSLTGFEALLRGKKVACYGAPFYSGWGLTEDFCPTPRRTRRLSLPQLVAGTLILYPTYVSRSTSRFTTPERALQELLAWRLEASQSVPLWRRLLGRGLKFRQR